MTIECLNASKKNLIRPCMATRARKVKEERLICNVIYYYYFAYYRYHVGEGRSTSDEVSRKKIMIYYLKLEK